MDRKMHWETIYQTKSPSKVSWYQERPIKSLQLIKEMGVHKDAQVIDIGGGASSLADHLLNAGYKHVTVLDISAKALENSKQRLGKQAKEIQWMVGDITQVDLPSGSYDIWHDRAVFHFLTQAEDRKRYVDVLGKSLKPGGHLIIATFAADGPPKCSGLDVMRYSADGLRRELGEKFRLVKSLDEVHQTPFDTQQKFVFCHFQKA